MVSNFSIKKILQGKLKADWYYLLILSIIFTVFVSIWYGLALYRLYHLYTAVYDLGLAAERIWLPLHSSQSISSILYSIFYGSIIPYLFSPISVISTSLKPLLFIQTIFIWASVFPIYAIARKKELSPFTSFLIGVSFFFYFPLAGLNFFDFHMEAFFPFFFLLAYALYIYQYRKISLIFFIITSLTKFPFDIFVAIFAFEEIFLYFWSKRDNKERPLLIPVFLFLVSTGSLILGEVLSLAGPHYISTFLHVSTNTILPLGSIMLTMFIIFGAVLFLPLKSKRWVLFFVPFIILAIISMNPAYYFPDIFTDQYSSMFIAFIFLGIIDVVANRHKQENSELIHKKMKKHKLTQISASTSTVFSILIILVLMSAAFQPWSPLVKDNNYMNNIYYDCPSPYNNRNVQEYLCKEGNMIPRTNPYVLVPNNIPEAYPRELVNGPYSIGELVMGFPNPVFKNITISDAKNNTYPYIAWNGTIVNIPIDYAWATLMESVFYSKSGYQSMCNIMQIMLDSGKYGIMAEANNTIVLERGYTGKPEFYIPMNQSIYPADGGSRTAFKIMDNAYYFKNVSAGSIMWYGGTKYFPGTDNNTLNFSLSSSFKGNVSIEEMMNNSIVDTKFINVTNALHNKVRISFNQMFTNIEPSGYYYFIIKSDGFNGGISFNGVSVSQISPPNSIINN